MALAKRGILTLKYPVEGGIVVNWDDWEKMTFTLFYEHMRVAPEEHIVCTVVHPRAFFEKPQLSKQIQIFFETFNVPILAVVPADVATLYACDKRTHGVVVSSGKDVTVVSSVVDGRPIKSSVMWSNFGGATVTATLRRAVVPSDGSQLSDGLVEELKSKVCFVSPLDIRTMRDIWTPSPLNLKTESDATFTIDSARFECCEGFFDGSSGPSLVDMIEASAAAAGLPGSAPVCLAGKNTLFPGLVDRLKREMGMRNALRPVVVPVMRGEAPYAGASLMMCQYASHGYDHPILKSKEYYDENGPDVMSDFLYDVSFTPLP